MLSVARERFELRQAMQSPFIEFDSLCIVTGVRLVNLISSMNKWSISRIAIVDVAK
jgi:hypothetical protein